MTMNAVAVEVDQIWKKFNKGEKHNALRDLIPYTFRRLSSSRRAERLEEKEFWALKNVSFQVERGEAVGVIGHNGAGKSTILKLLSNIMRPNKGIIRIQGKLSALIEVGAGFHPDLTGRENVYLNGAILGMNRKEIDRKFDEIVEFSGISDFIDMPVKRYSSGMYARLGFSVAAHVDPDILLVDEVLSVGDLKFQQKCMEKMLSFKNTDKAIIFVSHNIEAINMLCNRTVLMASGELVKIGKTSEVVNEYLFSGHDAAQESDDQNMIRNIELLNDQFRKSNSFSPGDRANLSFKIRCEDFDACVLGFLVNRVSDGVSVCDYNIPLSRSLSGGGDGYEKDMNLNFFVNLLRGSYVIHMHIYNNKKTRHLYWTKLPLYFSVSENVSWRGIAHLDVNITSQ